MGVGGHFLLVGRGSWKYIVRGWVRLSGGKWRRVGVVARFSKTHTEFLLPIFATSQQENRTMGFH